MGLPRESRCWCTALRIVFRAVAEAASAFSLWISGKLHIVRPPPGLLDFWQQEGGEQKSHPDIRWLDSTLFGTLKFRASEQRLLFQGTVACYGSVAGSPA